MPNISQVQDQSFHIRRKDQIDIIHDKLHIAHSDRLLFQYHIDRDKRPNQQRCIFQTHMNFACGHEVARYNYYIKTPIDPVLVQVWVLFTETNSAYFASGIVRYVRDYRIIILKDKRNHKFLKNFKCLINQKYRLYH
jgi:hypothetical protein